MFGAAAVVAFLQVFAGSSAPPPPGPAPSGVPLPPDENAAVPVAFGVLGILLAVAVIAILVLARLWLRRTRDDEDEVPETREIDRGDREIGRARARRRGRFLRRPVPRDAAGAYRMLLEDLDEHPALRREDGETPVEHAARLRAAGHGRLALELLAADYGLARFGGVAMTERETRRAIARSRSLARDLPRSLERLSRLAHAAPGECRDAPDLVRGAAGARASGPWPSGSAIHLLTAGPRAGYVAPTDASRRASRVRFAVRLARTSSRVTDRGAAPKRSRASFGPSRTFSSWRRSSSSALAISVLISTTRSRLVAACQARMSTEPRSPHSA